MKKGRIPDAWFASQVEQANRNDGDIDTLSGRIAQIRTWTFVANRPDWLADPEHWQGITREVENKLSDALHERLTERFVDRRTSVLMRRLRENTMLNTEIGKTGEVIVEGHVIGRLDGFTFAPDAAEAGSDAKALQATAQKALAGEIDARAEKLSAAPDDQFVLTSDGTIRWTGDAVAKLMAADDALHPRIRIISDDRLSGAPREAVQTRLELWLKTHIEKLLGPLFDLSKAEDITGIARGIAFQLIEALGVLERARIAAEMKDLDQPSRASLRKYGVRFGAYHIYLPALLKPAARSLASLLWALKQDNVDMSALSGAQHLAGSGRTSFPVDKQLDRDAYRVLGYRQCGERAVRVDILERLADLIRPALAWRETSPGDKPAGAFDGRGFVVTQAMTSLTGSAGEDFASILRALGYRMERRTPPPPKPAALEPAAVEVPPAEAAPAEAASETLAEAAAIEAAAASANLIADETPAAAERSELAEDLRRPPSASLLPDIAFAEPASTAQPDTVEAQPEPEASSVSAAVETLPGQGPAEALAEVSAAAETTSAPAVVIEATRSEASAAAATPDAAAPELVDVWRPGGRSEERRPRQHDRNRHRHQERPAPGEQQAAGAAGEGGEAAKGERHRRGRRARHRDSRNPRPDAPAEAVTATAGNGGAPAHEEREQQPRERLQGKPRSEDRNKGKFRGDRDNGGRDSRDKGGREIRGGRDKGGRDSGPSHRQYATSASPRERERPIDPNSPFAKLAALKDQLAGNRKD
jgi:ATP-dependent RNA helicase SUPV3L1/SUV3